MLAWPASSMPWPPMHVASLGCLVPCWQQPIVGHACKHYEKTVLRPRFQNAALGHKNAALGPFGLRPRFLRPRYKTRPKTCDYRPGRSKAALFEPWPKTRSYSRGKNAASDRSDLSTLRMELGFGVKEAVLLLVMWGNSSLQFCCLDAGIFFFFFFWGWGYCVCLLLRTQLFC